MSKGSGLFSTQFAKKPHLLQAAGGIASEIKDLRDDLANELAPMAAIAVEELTNVAASDTAGLHIAAASTLAAQTISTFVAGGVTALAAYPRSVKFTTAGVTPSDVPATALVTGKGANGAVISETVSLAQTATSVETVKCYSSLTSVVYAVGQGTAGTVAIGLGVKLGLANKLKARASVSGLIREIVGGAVAQVPADIAVDEWTNSVAASTTGLHAATATTVAVQTILPGALVAGGVAALLAYPRNVTFTTAGVTPSDAPASVVVTGTDIDNNVLAETIVLSQSATTDAGVKAFKTITSIVYGAGVGTAATVAVGFGAVFGLSHSIKLRAGYTKAIQEIAIGAVVTTGTYVAAASSPPHGTYAPASAPDGAKDYAVYYEAATSAGSVVESAAVSAPNGSYTPSVAFDGTSDYTIYYEYDPTA